MKVSPVKREEEMAKIDNLLSFYRLENEKSEQRVKELKLRLRETYGQRSLNQSMNRGSA